MTPNVDELGDKELFGHSKIVSYPYKVNWQIGHRKWFFNTNLFLIKPFLTTKFDCTKNKKVCVEDSIQQYCYSTNR